MSNRYMPRLVFLCNPSLLRIWKISKLAQCLVFSVFHEGLQHLPIVRLFMYETQRECFPLLANDSCPTTEFFSALHINTVFLLVHLQQVPEVLNGLCTNMHDLQQFPFCVCGACDSGVCGGNEGSFSPRVCRQAISWKKELSSNTFLLLRLQWLGTQTSGHFDHGSHL